MTRHTHDAITKSLVVYSVQQCQKSEEEEEIMDIYPFIDSQAVREHLQKLNYRRNYVRIFNRAPHWT